MTPVYALALALMTLLLSHDTFAESMELSRCYIFPHWDSSKLHHTGNYKQCRDDDHDNVCDGPETSVMTVGSRYLYQIKKSMLFLVADGKGGVIEHHRDVIVPENQWFEVRVRNATGPRDIKKAIPQLQKAIDAHISLKRELICGS